jgi:hypothetical protein
MSCEPSGSPDTADLKVRTTRVEKRSLEAELHPDVDPAWINRAGRLAKEEGRVP